VIFDNFISVQGPFLPLRCRGDRLSPAVATDHQSAERGEQAVTRNPTGHAVERSWTRTGTRIHGCIVVTWAKPTRMMGLGQKGQAKGRASLQSPRRHPRDTRRSVGSSLQRYTEMRNGVTP
jgi:hypothetical protein